MKRYFLIGLFFTTALFIHCDSCDCDPGPFYGELKIKLTINNENPELWLDIFSGRIEDGDTIISEMISTPEVYYELEADNYYSATVAYIKNGRMIVTIDGKKMDIVTHGDDCNCESAEDITLNLKLAD